MVFKKAKMETDMPITFLGGIWLSWRFGLDSTDGPQVINEYVYKETDIFILYKEGSLYLSVEPPCTGALHI